jgi:hypothetical protein
MLLASRPTLINFGERMSFFLGFTPLVKGSRFKALETRPSSHCHLLRIPLRTATGPPRGFWVWVCCVIWGICILWSEHDIGKSVLSVVLEILKFTFCFIITFPSSASSPVKTVRVFSESFSSNSDFLSVWWLDDKNSLKVAQAWRKRQLKWVPSAWGYS